MPSDIAFLFPGQGAQHVGMGRSLADAFPEAAQTFQEADRAFGAAGGDGSSSTDSSRTDSWRTLSDLIFEGPEDQLLLTEHAQPAIVATSVAAWRVLAAHGCSPQFVAGHSLGEYSAHVAAGTFRFEDAVRAVRRRGQLMQDAVPVGAGAMAAILGAGLALVAQACDDVRGADVVSPANINAPGQVVIAGHTAAVQRASDRARELGAKKAVPLAVSAPFHCALMQPAQDLLAPLLRGLVASAPRMPVIANVDAGPRRDAASAVDALIAQVSAPVQWQATIEHLLAEGVRTFVEVGPGGVLSGLVKKMAKDVRVLRFSAPEELHEIVAACSA